MSSKPENGVLPTPRVLACDESLEATLRSPKTHPRLFTSASHWASLKARVRSGRDRRLFELVLQTADEALAEEPVSYQKRGKRLLTQCRACFKRVANLSLAANLTCDDRYRSRAILEMEAAAHLPDWNPSHFLDVGEMVLGLAIGYDWLHDEIEPAIRAVIAGAIVEKGLKTSFSLRPADAWWIDTDNNWNPVCHAGLVAGALAVQEHEPELARRIVARAIEMLPYSGASYAPDGSYPEGPGYWSYGTTFHVILISALESALGSDFGLTDFPGFLESARYIQAVTSPTKRYFNYSDTGDHHYFTPVQLWFADRLGDLRMIESQMPPADDRWRLLPFALLWDKTDSETKNESAPLDWMARGGMPLAVHRTAWDDPEALFVAIKGGSPSTNHGHMDSGSFVLESDGIRWAVDPGSEDYFRLESMGLDVWNKAQGADRWRVFRLNHESHNVLVFDGGPQQVGGNGALVRFHTLPGPRHTVLDLSPLYSRRLQKVMRGVALLPGAAVLFQDEWTAGGLPLVARWQMLTHATITIREDGRQIILEQDGRSLILKIALPSTAVFFVSDVSFPAALHDSPNPGLSRIEVLCQTAAQQSQTLRILAIPGSANDAIDVPPCVPLEEWADFRS